MALIKTRVHHKNDSGTYDTFHYETSADVVLYTNNSQTTVSGALDSLFSGKSNSNHTHGNITNAGLLATGSRAVITDANKKITVQDNTVEDPGASGTSTVFINAASQSSTGKITVTKANLPTASTLVAGITKLGASGGAATYAHNHNTTYAPITHNHDGAEITTGIVARDKLQAMTGASASAAGAGGAVPAPAAGDNTKFLRGDGTWVVPTNTTYSTFVKSGSTAAAGLVPKPSTTAGTTKYLREDATWAVPPDTTYTPASTPPKMDGTAAVGTSAKYAREDHVHPTDTSRAAANHTHSSNDITALNASKLTGTIDIARLPAAALERVVTVANQAARYALTKDTVQLGDVVKETESGLMYYVVDETKLGKADGYTEFTAGQAAAVPWSGITSKPSSFTPASHTHGNITNDGKVGTTLGYAVYTTTGGAVTAGSLATTDPKASGTSKTFIDTISQDAKGQITATKKTVATMTAATADAAGTTGLVPKPSAGDNTKFLRGDGTWVVPTNTTYSTFVKSGSTAAAGLVPKPSTTAGTTKYLREDATWAVPPNDNTTYSTFVKSGSTAAAGLVPKPSTTAGTTKYLREDATWVAPPNTNTTYTFATGSSNGTISVTPSGGSATDVAVKGLGSAAYTASTAYAAASHDHAASNITSGTLGVARGGTGATSALAAITALGGWSHLSKGTSIASTAAAPKDLNTYTTPGVYYSANADESATIANAPTSSTGFKLHVLQNYSANYKFQLVISGGETLYYRSSTNSGNTTWSNWKRLRPWTATTGSIGSASAGTAIAAADITAWNAGTAASASIASGVLTISNGTAPSLSYTAKSIPNISVTSKNVVTEIS